MHRPTGAHWQSATTASRAPCPREQDHIIRVIAPLPFVGSGQERHAPDEAVMLAGRGGGHPVRRPEDEPGAAAPVRSSHGAAEGPCGHPDRCCAPRERRARRRRLEPACRGRPGGDLSFSRHQHPWPVDRRRSAIRPPALLPHRSSPCPPFLSFLPCSFRGSSSRRCLRHQPASCCTPQLSRASR